MQSERGFASDNWSGVHPEVLEALARANRGHAPAYGDDGLTARVREHVKRLFGETAEVVPVAAPSAKLTPALLDRVPIGHAPPHHVVPRVLTITNATELGTAYTPEERRALAEWAHAGGMRLHVDGATCGCAARGTPTRWRSASRAKQRPCPASPSSTRWRPTRCSRGCRAA